MSNQKYIVNGNDLKSIADSIRSKTGETENLLFPDDFVNGIDSINASEEGGTDVSDTTATQSDVLSGKYFYNSSGIKKQGTIATKTQSDLSASGKTVTVPSGYYASQVTKDVATGSTSTPATTITANPSISVSSSGKITASVSKTQSVTPTVSAGYITSGTAGNITVSGSSEQQLSTQGSQTITPGTSDQVISSGKYLTGNQTIKGDTNLISQNIKIGKSIFGVPGSFSGGSGSDSSLYTDDEDVLFYDDLMNNGDGGIYYACSAAELQAMTSLPENPDHSDYSTQGISIPMTSQGWNWTLADAKAQVAATGKIEIGQMYKPTDEKSHYVLYVPENDKRKKFTVMIEVTGGSVTYKLDNEAEQTASETFTITFATFGWHHLTISAGAGVTYKHQELSIGRNQICKYLLKEAYFSDKVSFADQGLYKYFNLEKITLAYGMESFDSTYVFYGNNTLKRLTIPSGITTIGTSLFFYCYNLKYISIPKSVTRFEDYVFTNTYNIKRITIPINITELGIYMFNESGVKSIDISSTNLIEIESFRNAQRLEEAHFEHTTATEIGSYAFYLCSSLRKVVLPSTITNIENQAFSETGVLEEIVLLSTTPPTLGGNILYNSADDVTIIVPAGYGNTYKATSGWSDYASNIVEATT